MYRSCYKDVVGARILRRTRKVWEAAWRPQWVQAKIMTRFIIRNQLTCSKTSPYNKNVCFFCDGPPSYRKNLHNINTFSTAIGMSGNDKLSVKLDTSIAPDGSHAIDIKYPKTVGQFMYCTSYEEKHPNHHLRSWLVRLQHK